MGYAVPLAALRERRTPPFVRTPGAHSLSERALHFAWALDSPSVVADRAAEVTAAGFIAGARPMT